MLEEGSCFLICGYRQLHAQDRYRNFLEELTTGMRLIPLRLRTLKIDGIVIMARLGLLVYSRMDVSPKDQFPDETLDQGFLE